MNGVVKENILLQTLTDGKLEECVFKELSEIHFYRKQMRVAESEGTCNTMNSISPAMSNVVRQTRFNQKIFKFKHTYYSLRIKLFICLMVVCS